MLNNITALLRWSEKYTKTDMMYLMQGGIWLLLAQSAASISALVVTVVLANNLDQELFGQYRFLLSIISVLSIFSLPGIGTALTRSVSRGNTVSLISIAYTKIKWGVIGSVCAVLLAFYYAHKGEELISYSLALVAIFLPFLETFLIYSFYYRGKSDFKISATYETISRITQALLLISVGFLYKNLLIFITVFLLGQILTRLVFFLKTLRREAADNTYHQSNNDDTIHYGKRLSLITAVGIVTSNIDKLFVWHFLGAKVLAMYAIALALPLTIVLVFNVIPKIALPKFSRSTWQPSDYQQVFRKLSIFMTLLCVPTILYLAIAPFLLVKFFPSYDISFTTIAILGSLIVTLPLNATIAQIFRATKSIFDVIVQSFVLLSVFSVIFISTHTTLGINAAAIGLAVGNIIILLIGVAYLMQKSRMGSSD